jgi:hypothetical protein
MKNRKYNYKGYEALASKMEAVDHVSVVFNGCSLH